MPPRLTVFPSEAIGKLDIGTWAWVDPYETNDNYRTARDLLSGEVIEGYIEHANDDDIFKLDDLTTGDTVNVTLTSLPDDYKLTSMRGATTAGTCPTRNQVSVGCGTAVPCGRPMACVAERRCVGAQYCVRCAYTCPV